MASNDKQEIHIHLDKESFGGMMGASQAPAPRGSNIGAIVGGILILGALGVGGYLFYNWYKDRACTVEGDSACIDDEICECTPWPNEDLKLFLYYKGTGDSCDSGGECTPGATKCVDDVSYECNDNGYWEEGGEACETTEVLCIEDAVRCASGKKVQCQDKEWVPIGDCTVADCVGITCVSSQVLCDEDDTAYYQIYCDPRTNTCKPTMYLPEAAVCKNAGVASIAVDINGQSSQPVIIDMETTCGDPDAWNEQLARYPVINWNVVVKDAYGRYVDGARIKILCNSSKSLMGFVDPSDISNDWDEMAVTCGKFEFNRDAAYTDENGQVQIMALVMFTPEITRTEVFTIQVIYNGKTVSTTVQVQILGSSYGENDESCHGAWVGGNICRLD